MIADERGDLITRSLQHLPRLEPDPARAERHRARCRIALAQLQQPADGFVRRAGFTACVIEWTLVAVLCAGYLSAVAHDVLRLYKMQ